MAIGKTTTLIENGRTTLTAAFATLALRLQEAADMPHSTVRNRLQKAVQDAHKGTGKYAYMIDHTGDGESGKVIYQCDGDTKSAPYDISDGDGTADTSLDLSKAKTVIPTVSYPEQADDDDHYARMSEGFIADKIYDSLPLYERFISKSERDSIPAEDFAGKNRSYPVSNETDFHAALHAIGRAGSDNYSHATLHRNIIAIGKRKGYKMPDSETAKESARRAKGDTLSLVESAAAVEEITLRESAKADYEIKLIAPGKGATAYYPAEVLKRDGPTAFPAGTKCYANHPTALEESEGEGNRDVSRLAGVLTGAAEWKESHAKGPGLYSRMKVFSDHAPMLAEKAKYLAMSILAGGKQLIENGKKVFRDGVPVLAGLTHGESVDIVPKGGAGGLILAESAKTKKDCPDCAGTGDCATCKGTGKVAKKTGMGKEAARTMTECTDCQGSGDCATCAGDGTVMESARGATDTGDTMDEATLKRLLSEAVAPLQTKIAELDTKLVEAQSQTQPLLRRALEAEARNEATAALSDISMRESGKAYVVAECIKNIPVKDGKLDAAVFREAVTAKAKELAPIIGEGAGQVWGMNSAPAITDPKVREAAAAEIKRVREAGVDIFADLMGGDKKAAEAAISKGVIQ